MPRFKKQVLAPGTFVTRSGPVTIEPDDVKAFARTGNAMLADKLQVPVPLEHQPKAKPSTEEERLADLVTSNTGFVSSYDVDKDNVLWMNLDINAIPVRDGAKTHVITDPKQITAFVNNNVRYVSPELLPSFQDGRGKVWENVISHVALTNVPVWHDQLPFGEVGTPPVALSLTPARYSWRGRRAGVALSMTELWNTPVRWKGIVPAGVPIKLSKMSRRPLAPEAGIVIDGVFYRGGTPIPTRMAKGDNPMADDADEGAPPKGEEKDAAPEGDGDDTAPADDAGSKGGGSAKDWIEQANQIAKDALNIDLADGVSSPLEWIKHFVTAAKTAKAHQDVAAGADQGTPPAGADQGGAPKEEPQVVTMSHLDPVVRKQLADNEAAWKKRLDDMEAKSKAQLLSLEQHNKKANERAADAELRSLVSAIDGWIKDGFVAPAKWGEYKTTLTSKKLAIAQGNDDAVNDILDRIRFTAELIKEGGLKRGACWPVDQKTDLSINGDATEPARPEGTAWHLSADSGRPMSADKVKNVMAEIDTMMGRNGKK